MRIEVLVDGSEQACCGVPVRIGETASFNLVALDPAAEIVPPPAADVPRFIVDNHGQTPADVPQRRLSGIVTGITGISYPSIPVAGRAVGCHVSGVDLAFARRGRCGALAALR